MTAPADIVQFVTAQTPRTATLKSALMEYAARAAGVDVERVNRRLALVRSRASVIPFVDMNGPRSSTLARTLCGHKDRQRHVTTRRGLRGPESAAFRAGERQDALQYAENLGWPVVVKPATLSGGDGVTTAVSSPAAFEQAWSLALESLGSTDPLRRIVVEQHIDGDDFRIFVVGDQIVSVTRFVPCHVVGDGESTVGDLVRQKNELRARNPYLRDHRIPETSVATQPGVPTYRLSDVPAPGDRVVLGNTASPERGGEIVDCTDSVSSELTQLAVRAVRSVPGMSYGTAAILVPRDTNNGEAERPLLSGLEFAPAPVAHFPSVGRSRDMAGAILSYYLALE